MADNIGGIIDKPGIEQDIDAVIKAIVRLENEIKTANDKQISITVELKGAETLSDLMRIMKEVKVVTDDYTRTINLNADAAKTLADVQAKYGLQVKDHAKVLAEQRTELGYVTEQMKLVNKSIADGGGNANALSAQLVKLTQRQQELKVEIGATTTAIKTEIKEFNAAKGSMDEIAQALFQLKDKYRGLSEEQRTNSEVGGVMNAEIGILDHQIKQLDSSIGNHQRNVGNYTESIKEASTYLGNLEIKMRAMQKAGQEGSAEFSKYAAEAQKAKDIIANGPNSGTGSPALTTLSSQYKAAKVKVDELAGAQKKGTEEYRMAEAEVQRLGAEMRELNASLGKATFSIENLTGRLEKMGFRMLVHLLIFEAVMRTFDFLKTKTLEAIPGTDAWIAKQEKLYERITGLSNAYEELYNAMVKIRIEQDNINEAFSKDLHPFGFSNETIDNSKLDETVEGAKRLEAAVKALGIQSGEVYQAQKAQGDAAISSRQKEIDLISKQIEENTKLGNVLTRVQYLTKTYGTTADELSLQEVDKSALPEEVKIKLKNDIAKLFRDGTYGEIIEGVNKAVSAAKTKMLSLTQSKADKEGEQKNITTEEQSKLNELAYTKRLELEKQTEQLKEQFREANEKQEIASLDRIVADYKAKYALAAKEIERNMIATAKQFGIVGSGTFDEQLRKAKEILALQKDPKTGASLLSGFQGTLNLTKSISTENSGIATQAFRDAADKQADAFRLQSLNANAATLAGEAKYGVPDYNKMAAAQDYETVAKKQAEQNQFQDQQDAYLKLYGLTEQYSEKIEQITTEHNGKLALIDKEAYAKRVELVVQYFDAIKKQMDVATGLKSQEIAISGLQEQTGILNQPNTLFHGERWKDAHVKLSQMSTADQQAKNTIEANKALRGEALNAVGNTTQAFNSAQNESQSTSAEKAMNEAKKRLRDIDESTELAQNGLAQREDERRKMKLAAQEELKNKSIELAQATADAITTIQDNHFAKEMQQLEIKSQQLRTNARQEQDAINAKTEFQVQKDNELAKLAAQTAAQENAIEKQKEQIEIRKAKFDRDANIAKIIMATAAAEAQALTFLSDPVTTPFYPAIAAIIAATGAVQIAAAASAPIPEFRFGTPDGGTTTGTFIAGDGGRKELIAAPGKVPYWSSDKATVYNEPLGTHVIPLEKLYRYAWAYAGKPVEQPSVSRLESQKSEDLTIRALAGVLGEKFEDVSSDMVQAILMGRPVVNNKIVVNTNRDLQR